MQMNMQEVARLMQGVIEGQIAAQSFARAVQMRSGDNQWCIALGLAMRELGSLIEQTAKIPFEQQKALTAKAMHQAHQRQEALDRVLAERDELRILVRTLEADISKMRDQLDFLSMFTPPQPPMSGHDSPRPPLLHCR